MYKAERKQKKLQRKEIKQQKKLQREAKVRNFLDGLISGEKLKPENLKKILKIVILTVSILFTVEAVMSIPVVSGFFEQWLLDSSADSGKIKIGIYLTVMTITFLQVLPIFNMPMVPIILLLWKLDWLVTGSPGGGQTGFTNIELIFRPETLVLTLFILAGFMLGVIFNYYLGYLLGEKAYKWMNDGDLEGYKEWSQKFNGKTGRLIYFGTIVLPIFPDDLLIILAGSSKMDFKFVVLANAVGRYIGLITMMMFAPILSSAPGSEFPYMVVVYGGILLIALLWNFKNNRWLNLNMPKGEKIDSSFEEVINRIKKRTSVVEEVISDIAYKIDKKSKTKYNTAVDLLVFAVIDYEDYINRKIRILVRCQSANYFEVIFDKTYVMSERIEVLLKDLEDERNLWKQRILN